MKPLKTIGGNLEFICSFLFLCVQIAGSKFMGFSNMLICILKLLVFEIFSHSFSIYSHKKAINIYMLTCSEAVPQRCSHYQVLRKMRNKTTG